MNLLLKQATPTDFPPYFGQVCILISWEIFLLHLIDIHFSQNKM